MSTALEIESIGKTEDVLTMQDALFYLQSIGMPMSLKTLQNKMCMGKGPARFRRLGRVYFRKVDLDIWKKHETKVFKAYE